MNISFEIIGDSVGVNDLALAVNRLGLTARLTTVTKLGNYGPKPGLMVTFDAIPDHYNADTLLVEIQDSLELAGIEVDHG